MSGFFDILIGYRDIHIESWSSYKFDVLRKWTPQENFVKYQNFPTHFGLSSLEYSGEISRQSAKSTNPINSLKVDVFLQNQKVKVHKQLAPRTDIITANKTANQWQNRCEACVIQHYEEHMRLK